MPAAYRLIPNTAVLIPAGGFAVANEGSPLYKFERLRKEKSIQRIPRFTVIPHNAPGVRPESPARIIR